MRIWNERKLKTPLLHYFLFAYWFILLLWQNIGGSTTHSAMDLIIKCGLILMLFVYYFMHMTGLRRDVLKRSMLLILLYGAVKLSNGMALSEALYYFFPLMFILLIYGVGGSFELNRKQLLTMCNMLIVVVAYTAIYALIFCFEQFENVFTITSAYGNELKSFLFSSHEYGLYLAFAIMAAILCLELDKELTQKKRGLYYTAIVLFSVNLIMTFSRTSFLALGVMLLCYTVAFARKGLRSTLCWSLITAIVLILIIPSLRDFFWQIVMKENNDAGREDLTKTAMTFFEESTIFEKIVGRDFYYVNNYLQSSGGISSFHNAYITLLVSNGIIGVVLIVVMIILSLYDIYATAKSKTELGYIAKFFIGPVIAAALVMMVNTTVLFASSIDSYFLTLFAVIVPRYVHRSIRSGRFDCEKELPHGK